MEENKDVLYFDSKGGTEVEKIEVECNKELVLPTPPTKNGYNFVSWVDKNETHTERKN